MQMSFLVLRKLNLHFPLGEICPLTRIWTFFLGKSGIAEKFYRFFPNGHNDIMDTLLSYTV